MSAKLFDSLAPGRSHLETVGGYIHRPDADREIIALRSVITAMPREFRTITSVLPPGPHSTLLDEAPNPM
jgi:hypothetical protein